uniref:Uncharacterized protein n=1 Tax=Rhizophora mucronata TaxID=61149 RepID=A0A2P2PSS3_RHIMU
MYELAVLFKGGCGIKIFSSKLIWF